MRTPSEMINSDPPHRLITGRPTNNALASQRMPFKFASSFQTREDSVRRRPMQAPKISAIVIRVGPEFLDSKNPRAIYSAQ